MANSNWQVPDVGKTKENALYCTLPRIYIKGLFLLHHVFYYNQSSTLRRQMQLLLLAPLFQTPIPERALSRRTALSEHSIPRAVPNKCAQIGVARPGIYRPLGVPARPVFRCNPAASLDSFSTLRHSCLLCIYPLTPVFTIGMRPNPWSTATRREVDDLPQQLHTHPGRLSCGGYSVFAQSDYGSINHCVIMPVSNQSYPVSRLKLA